jgi:hypothetical protein
MSGEFGNYIGGYLGAKIRYAAEDGLAQSHRLDLHLPKIQIN